jgi:CBS domain-containing protein
MTDDELPSVRDTFVGNVMSETVQTVPADASAAEAAGRLFESDIGSLLVGNGSAPPEGIITETDFVELTARARDPETTTVKRCMSSPVITVSIRTRLAEAARRMNEEKIKKLPVVTEETNRVEGIVTTTDIAKYLPVHEFHPEE